MDEQGGAGGVPHGKRHTWKAGRSDPARGDGRTAAADTDEASRLDRPATAPNSAAKHRRWVSPADHEEKRGDSDE